MAQIVIDKSFLDGTKPPEVGKLCEQAALVMTDSLFYELITTKKDSLRRCFRWFLNCHNPVMIVALGALLRVEMEVGRPYGGLAEHAVKKNCMFNDDLGNGTFVFDDEDYEAKKQWQDHVKERTQVFIERCLCVHEFFPELSGIPMSDFPEAITQARYKVAKDHDFVRYICTRIMKCESARLDASWAWFRLIQSQFLGALRLFGKWQGKFPSEVGEPFYTRTEHSMFDADYVAMGALAGGIATLDKQIREDFLMLCPQGELIPSVVEVTKRI